jgi:hypothetical protein
MPKRTSRRTGSTATSSSRQQACKKARQAQQQQQMELYIAGLQLEKQILAAQLANVEREAEPALNYISTLLERVYKYRATTTAAQQQVADLQTQLNQATQQVEPMRTALQTLQAAHDLKCREAAAAQQEVEGMQKLLSQAQQQLEQHGAKLRSAENNYYRLRSKAYVPINDGQDKVLKWAKKCGMSLQTIYNKLNIANSVNTRTAQLRKTQTTYGERAAYEHSYMVDFIQLITEHQLPFSKAPAIMRAALQLHLRHLDGSPLEQLPINIPCDETIKRFEQTAKKVVHQAESGEHNICSTQQLCSSCSS